MTNTPATAASDNRAEFEATCLQFMRALYGTALRLTHRREDASDLVQETLLRAYRTFPNFERGTNAKAWLFRILYSVFINRYHKERREPERVSLEEVDERFLAAQGDWVGPSNVPTPESVETAVRQLPEVFRAAVVLVDVEGLSYEEAAAALGCPVGTLRSRLSRGRRLVFVGLREREGASALSSRGSR